MSEHLDVVVPDSLTGQRVDRVLSMLTGMPRRDAAELVAAGQVRVDGATVRTRSAPLRGGQRLESPVPERALPMPRADAGVDFGVVHEDADVVVVDKPAGLVVHHGAGHGGGTLVDGLLARYPDLATTAGLGDPARPGIVHRIDKGTSGLLVVARSARAFESLSRQFRAHTAARRYVALVAGLVADDAGVVDAPIARSVRRPDRMAVRAGGRPARTGYEVRRRASTPVPVSLVEASLETGRTHQVRVHLAAIGHPVVGDDRYGGAAARPPALVGLLGPGRVFLHAALLGFEHPDGSWQEWRSPLPADLERVLAALGD
ncbi:MAG: RluA family pseudouridine synthase [Acidimicrobiales bacterium]